MSDESKTQLVIYLIIICISMLGCSEASSTDPVAQFARNNPDDFKTYTYIRPTSLNICEMFISTNHYTVNDIALTIKNKFGNNPEAIKYADRILKYEAIKKAQSDKLFIELDNAASNGGTICEYEWIHDNNRETGLLVLKSGVIVKRVSFLDELIGSNPSSQPSQ